MITITELAKEYGIHRNTMHNVLKKMFPNRKPYLIINNKLHREIKYKLGEGRFVKINTICKMYGITHKTLVNHLKNVEISNEGDFMLTADFKLLQTSYSNKLYSPRQKSYIFFYLGKPETVRINKRLVEKPRIKRVARF